MFHVHLLYCILINEYVCNISTTTLQGNVGGGLATYMTEVLDPGWFDDDDYKSLLVLGGMTAPLGALFQAPMLGALMIHELGEPPKYVLLQ